MRHLGQGLTPPRADGVNKPDPEGHGEQHGQQVKLHRPLCDAAAPVRPKRRKKSEKLFWCEMKLREDAFCDLGASRKIAKKCHIILKLGEGTRTIGSEAQRRRSLATRPF